MTQIPNIPREIATALELLQADLERLAGNNLAGLVLYGGLARGRFRPGKSDVNVLVLLHDASPSALLAVMPALLAARRSVGVDPMLLTPAEVPRAAAAFPTKFLDIRNHHQLLLGEDPFAALEVSREEVRRRVLQALQNLLMRLRHGFLVAAGDPLTQTRMLAGVARPLALELQSLLALRGHDGNEDDSSAMVFAAAAAAFGLDAPPLAQLAGLRHDAVVEDPAALFAAVLVVVARAVELVEADQGLADG